MRRPSLAVVSCLAGAALLLGGLSPAMADEGGPGGAASVTVGGFALGDGLEASIDEHDGSLAFSLPAGGVALAWNARATGVDRHGLGPGWGFGLGAVHVDGGVVVRPASGGAYAADASSPSGLFGYASADVRFEQSSGALGPRTPDTPGERPYAFVLHELGGASTYFDASGDPVVQLTATGRRTDWEWAADGSHRLTAITDADGVVTTLAWDEQRETVVVRRGANLPGAGEPWTIRLRHGRVVGTTDPMGGRVDVATDAAGVITSVDDTSGSHTDIEWQEHLDGVLRVDRLTTSDTDGAARSTRSWRAAAALPSGWPLVEAPRPGLAGVALTGPAGGHSTVVGDGATEVESTYNAVGSLIRRVTSGATGSGRRVLQEQAFRYPGTDEHGTPTPGAPELAKSWSHPSEATSTFRGTDGAERSGTLRTAFDDFGRLTEQTGVDGVTTSYTYDSRPGNRSDAGSPPIGLQTSERRVAPDGLVEEVRHELNEAGTAVTATTEYAGHIGGELQMTRHTRYTVEPDGFVSERAEYPADPATAPRVTRWARTVDLATGTSTLTETVAADTVTAVSTSSTVSLAHGGVLAETGPTGNVSVAEYDRLGRVAAVTDPSGRVTTTAYETAQGDGRNAVIETGPDGVATTELHDAFGRVIRIVDNVRDGRAEPGHERVVESREYPAAGLVRSTDAWGAVSTKRLDVFGRTVELTAPNGLHTVTEFDDVDGTVTSGATPSGRLTDAPVTATTAIDAAGRTVGSAGARADGAPVPEVSTLYDGFGRPVATAGGDVSSATEYDLHGLATDQTFTPSAPAARNESPGRGRSMSVTQEFDGFGSATQKTVSDHTASYSGVARTSDLLGRTVSATDQAGVVTSTTYTPDGLIATTSTSTGQHATFEYDPTTRKLLSAVRTAPGREPVTTQLEHDPATGALTAVFDPTDRRGTELSYTYDAFGNITSVSYPVGTTIAHEYDEHGRREATTDVVGNTTRYTHDRAGLLTGATQSSPDGTVLASIAYAYDAYGRMASATRGNGLTTEYEYNAVSDLTREVTALDGDVTADRAYTYDPNGRLTQRIDRVRDDADGSSAAPLTATTTTYAYDAFDRLTTSSVHDGGTTDAPITTTTSYATTVAGDLSSERVTTAPGTADERTTERSFEYTPAGALTSITTTDESGTSRATQVYDADGNLTRDVDGASFTYDAANRVTTRTTTDGMTTRTSYWADGRRRALTSTGAATAAEASSAYYWDGDTLLNDTHTGTGTGTGTGTDDAGTGSYLIGAIRQARTVTTGDPERPTHRTSYLGTDRHGNTTDLTDERGAVLVRYAYTDFGVATETRVAGASAAPAVGDAMRNPFQYAAGHTDPSGDQYLRTRSYDADTMRFTTADPAPMLTNYGYGGLNPIMNVDPSGRAEIGDYVINGVLIGAAVITGFFTAASIGLPTGGLSFGGYAAWTVGLFAGLGDLASTGIAIAEIVHDAGIKILSDEQREILRVSGMVVGVAAALAGPTSARMLQRSRWEDWNARALASNNPLARIDRSPVRPNQLQGMQPADLSRLFSKKFQFQIDALPEHYAVFKSRLTEVATKIMPAPNATRLEVYNAWTAESAKFDRYFDDLRADSTTSGARYRDVNGGTEHAVDRGVKAILADRKTIDQAMRAWHTKHGADAERDEPVSLYPPSDE